MNPEISAELGPPQQAVLLEQRGGGFLLPAPVGCLLKGHQKESSSSFILNLSTRNASGKGRCVKERRVQGCLGRRQS